MPAEQGCVIITDVYGETHTPTFTCSHCNKVVKYKSASAVHEHGDFCRSCMTMICNDCAGKPCTPFLKKLEAYERRYNARRSYGVLDDV
jgi:hypothetical protein